MAYRRLLLPLTGTASGEAALATALMVARIWNAHVHCLHVRVDARDVAPLAGEGLSGAMIEEGGYAACSTASRIPPATSCWQIVRRPH